jgi:hypothetical protein
MDELLFEAAFSGQIHDDAKLDEVKANIARIFKADEVTMARLFSGKRIVIKKNLTAEAADKYSIAFAKAGAICELTLMPEDTTPPVPADDQAVTKTPSSASIEKLWGQALQLTTCLAQFSRRKTSSSGYQAWDRRPVKCGM